jgi:hypothetical protein
VLYNIADEQATAFQRLEDQLTYCHDASPSAEILLDTDKIFVRLSTGHALAFKFGQVAMQVLCIAMLVNSLHPALEDCELFLNRASHWGGGALNRTDEAVLRLRVKLNGAMRS